MTYSSIKICIYALKFITRCIIYQLYIIHIARPNCRVYDFQSTRQSSLIHTQIFHPLVVYHYRSTISRLHHRALHYSFSSPRPKNTHTYTHHIASKSNTARARAYLYGPHLHTKLIANSLSRVLRQSRVVVASPLYLYDALPGRRLSLPRSFYASGNVYHRSPPSPPPAKVARVIIAARCVCHARGRELRELQEWYARHWTSAVLEQEGMRF